MKRPIDRAIEKIQIQSNGCWMWTGAKNKWGYGLFGISNKHLVAAHRFFYNLGLFDKEEDAAKVYQKALSEVN